MHYYIDPKMIYWMHVFSELGVALLFILVALLFISAAVSLWYITEEPEKIPQLKRSGIMMIIAMAICVIGLIFIPDEKTMKEMLIASYVTEEDVGSAKEEVRTLVDYIFEKVEQAEEK